MNSKLQKILATGLAAVSAAACVVSAAAANTAITVDQTTADTHTYSVYQIMTGEVSGTTLYGATWGKSGTGTGAVAQADLLKLQALSESGETDAALIKGVSIDPDGTAGSGDEYTTKITDFVDFSKSIGSVSKDSESIDADCLDSTTKCLVPGYYLLKDKDAVTGSDTYSLYITKVASGTTLNIARKAAKNVPTVTKKVNDKVGDSAAADDYAKYTVAVTLPDNYADYTAYTLKLKDTCDAGLTFVKDTAHPITVTMGTTDVTSAFTIPATLAADVQTLEISAADLKTACPTATKDSVFTFTYYCKVKDTAVIGSVGNANNAQVSFSNDPNSTTVGTTSSGTDSVKVYTYKLVINETVTEGSTDVALPGVKLTLVRNSDGKTYPAVTTDNAGQAVWNDLDDGEYTLKTEVPSGYKAVADRTFTITPTISDKGALTGLTVDDKAFSADYTTGTVSATFNNATSTSLPVTGAIGLVALMATAGIAGGAALVMRKKENDD